MKLEQALIKYTKHILCVINKDMIIDNDIF